MDEKLTSLLAELEQFGRAYDTSISEHSRKMLNIEPETGQFLALMVRALRAKRVLELGTSNGYSTLWLAYALTPIDGRLVTVEHQPHKAELARANFERSGLLPRIHSYLGNAPAFLKSEPAASFDVIFLDSERSEYASMWLNLDRVLVPGGLMIADNATSHPGQLDALIALAQAAAYMTTIAPIGKGELLVEGEDEAFPVEFGFLDEEGLEAEPEPHHVEEVGGGEGEFAEPVAEFRFHLGDILGARRLGELLVDDEPLVRVAHVLLGNEGGDAELDLRLDALDALLTLEALNRLFQQLGAQVVEVSRLASTTDGRLQ